MMKTAALLDSCRSNRDVIERVFRRREQGASNREFIRLLDDSLRWQITGSSKISKVFSKKEFLRVFKRVGDLLTGRPGMKVRQVLADGDWVVLRWDGFAVSSLGVDYNNQYCWFFRMKNGKIMEAVTYVDTLLVNKLLDTHQISEEDL